MHQSVVDVFHVGVVRDREFLLQDNASRVDVLVKEKGRHARHRLAIDDGPVDRCGATILRK